MKKRKNVKGLLVFIITLCLFLTACGNASKSKDEKGADNNGVDVEKKEKVEKKEDVEKKEETENVWTDKDNLIKIWKEDEDYFIYYNLDNWEKVHDIYNYTSKQHPEGILKDKTLLIDGLTEDIKDIAIVSIDGYGGYEESYNDGNDFPLVFMLMESGKITWFRGYPPLDWDLDGEEVNVIEEERIYGYLPYLEDIESLSYESDGKKVEEVTLFAIDKKGNKYDVRHAIDIEGLAFNLYTAFPARDHGGKYKLITIELSQDDEAKIVKTIDAGESITYTGTYELLDSSSSTSFRTPTIRLNMSLENEKTQVYEEKDTFNGVFLLDKGFESISFYRLEGDTFEDGIEELEFHLGFYDVEDIE